MNRKAFIKICGVACVGASTLSVLLQSCATTNYFAVAVIDDNKISIKKTEFLRIENNKQVTRKYVLIKTEKLSFPICVFKLSNENYSALLMECTHKSCELQPAGNFLTCPCHGSEFTNQGIVQNPPAEENLKSFKISTDNENIYIQL